MIQHRQFQVGCSFVRRSVVDLLVIAGFLGVAYAVVSDLDLFERLYQFSRTNDAWEFDDVFVVTLLAVIGGFAFGIRRLLDQRREIRARIRSEDEAVRMSLVDPLTGIANRRGFEQYLHERLTQLKGCDGKLALLLIDLDRFKPVNDCYGHDIGDEVLIEFANRTRGLVGDAGLFARLAGDEFAIVLSPVGAAEVPRRLARRMLSMLQFPMQVASGAQIDLGASIGIAMAPEDGIEPRTLFKRADIALYRAKDNGRRGYYFFRQPSEPEAAALPRLDRAS